MNFQKLFQKFVNRETMTYLVVGVLTTAVDYLVFWLVNEALKRTGMGVAATATWAQAVSWSAAVVFAYFGNRIVVFRSKNTGFRNILGEFGGFVAARAVSGAVVLILQWLLIDKLGMNEYLAKIAGSVFNIVFNYFAGKFLIFKSRETSGGK